MEKGSDSAMSKALKKKMDDHMSSMSKGFNPVTPSNADYLPMETGEGERLYFPNFYLKLKDIPEAREWEVGKRYKLEIVVQETELTQRTGEEPRVEFDVVGVKAMGPADEKVAKKDKKEYA